MPCRRFITVVERPTRKFSRFCSRVSVGEKRCVPIAVPAARCGCAFRAYMRLAKALSFGHHKRPSKEGANVESGSCAPGETPQASSRFRLPQRSPRALTQEKGLPSLPPAAESSDAHTAQGGSGSHRPSATLDKPAAAPKPPSVGSRDQVVGAFEAGGATSAASKVGNRMDQSVDEVALFAAAEQERMLAEEAAAT